MDSIRRKVQSTPFLFVLLATLWGGSFVAIDVGLRRVPPLLFAAVRYDVAGVLVLGYAALTRDRWLPTDRSAWVAIAVSSALLIAAFHALLYLGQGYVSGAIAAIVVSLVPLLTTGFDHALVGDTELEPVGGAGLAFGFVGVAVVANPTPSALDPTTLVGVGLVFLAAASFALGGVVSRPIRSGLPLASYQGWVMFVGGLLLHVGSVARGESVVVAWTPAVLAALAYLVVASSVVGYLLYFELLDRVGASELNLVNYLVPIVAALVGWIVLGDVLGPTAVTGFAVVFVGFALLKRDMLCRVVRTHSAVPDC